MRPAQGLERSKCLLLLGDSLRHWEWVGSAYDKAASELVGILSDRLADADAAV